MTDQEMEHYKALGEHYNNAYSVGDMPEYTVTTTCDGCKHKQEWISVEDRLPEKAGRYLTSERRFSLEDKEHTGQCIEAVDWADYDGKTFRRARCYEVIAWQPFPMPYKGYKE